MKRFHLKTFTLLSLPCVALAVFLLWVLPIFTRPVTLVSHGITGGEWFKDKGLFHGAEVYYPLSLAKFVKRQPQNAPSVQLSLLDEQGHRVQGLSGGVLFDSPHGRASGGTFYKWTDLKNLRGPLRFQVKTSSSERLLSESQVELNKLPRQVGQELNFN